MEIVLCGDCGFLGTSNYLITRQIKEDDVNPEVMPIIYRNGMSCRFCPLCNSAKIFYRAENSNIPRQSILSKQSIETKQEEDIIDPEVLKDIFESVSIPSITDPKKKENIKREKAKPNRVVNTSKRYKKKCDTCRQDFEVKSGDGEFGTRCKACLDKVIG